MVKMELPKIDLPIAQLQSASNGMARDISEAVLAGVLDVHAKAVSPGYAPRDTGTLARSITIEPPSVAGTSIQAAVGSNIAYARIHEFGGLAGRNHSVVIKPKLYLTRAIEENKEKIRQRFIKLGVIK